MQARLIITAAFAALALAVPSAQATMQDAGGAGDDSATSYLTPSALNALGQRGQAAADYYATTGGVRADDRGGVRGVGTSDVSARPDDRGGVRGVGTEFVPGVTDFPAVPATGDRSVQSAPSPVATPATGGIDWREIGFTAAALLALFVLVATRLRARQAGRSVSGAPTLSN